MQGSSPIVDTFKQSFSPAFNQSNLLMRWPSLGDRSTRNIEELQLSKLKSTILSIIYHDIINIIKSEK